jgi:hypothetical protein
MRQAMGRECELSFSDLFRMARDRPWTSAEEARFKALDQPARNADVRELAREAGGTHTEDRVGTDGTIYTAFWIERPTSSLTSMARGNAHSTDG